MSAADRVLVPTGADAGLVWHTGAPLREQRLAASGHGLVALSNRVVLQISGPMALGWLVERTHEAAGQTLVLDDSGVIVGGLSIAMAGAETLAWCESECAAAVRSQLCERALADREFGGGHLEIARRDDLQVVWVGTLSKQPKTFGTSALGGRVLLVPQGDPLPDESPIGVYALEALRIASGELRCGMDYRPGLPVAELEGKGSRRPVRCYLDGMSDELPDPGAEIESAGRVVGQLTSVAQHYELGPIGLGWLQRGVPTRPLNIGDCAVNAEWLEKA